MADAREADAHLRVAGISAGYGPVPVIQDITMTVARGEIVTVIGPNGAGKSTLLKAVTGALPLLDGSISLGGERIDGLRTDKIARRGVGYVPQARDVFESSPYARTSRWADMCFRATRWLRAWRRC